MLRIHKSLNVLNWISQSRDRKIFSSNFAVYTLPNLNTKEKASKKPGVFIKNKVAVNLIIEQFKKKLKPEDVLVEIFPGRGHLTKKILSSFKNKLLLCKPTNYLIKDIKTKFPSRLSNVSISDIEVLYFLKDFWLAVYCNKPEYHRKFVELLESHAPMDKSADLVIVGTIVDSKFFYSLILDYVYRASFFHRNLNPTFYIFVPYYLYKSLLKLDTSNTAVRLGTIYKAYFNIEVLGSAPGSCFHTSGFKKLHKTQSFASADFYLLRVSPKNFNNVMEKTGNNIVEFHNFLSYTIRSKAPSFLFAVENCVYDIGEELIQNGFRVFDNVSDISEDQWFRCFEIIKSHRHYKPSIYDNEIFGKEVFELHDETPVDDDEEQLVSNALQEEDNVLANIIQNEKILDDDLHFDDLDFVDEDLVLL